MNVDRRVPGKAVITEILGERTYRAHLPNGKEILAFYPRLRIGVPRSVGEEVRVALSLCDFSEGEIMEGATE